MMSRHFDCTFTQAYDHFKGLCEEELSNEDDLLYDEVEYTSLQGKHTCYAVRGLAKLEWTNALR